jgi:hypothetical protein
VTDQQQALQRMLPIFERLLKGAAFTADVAGQVQADMATLAAAPSAPAGQAEGHQAPVQPAGADDMRIALVVQVHSLISQIENTMHLFRGDEEGRKQAQGAIDHARKVAEPFNYNGATPQPAAQSAVSDEVVASALAAWFDTEGSVQTRMRAVLALASSAQEPKP